MSNFGIGLGAFVNGLSGGMQLGQQFKQMRNQKAIGEIREQGMADAKLARQADIDAGKDAKDLASYYLSSTGPKIRDKMLELGMEQEAMQWDSWLSDRKTKAGVEDWANGVKAFAMGDFDAATNSLIKAYNNNSYFPDGYSIEGKEVLENGGVRINIKGKDGKVFSQDFNNTEDMLRTWVTVGSPEQVFQNSIKQLDSLDSARAGVMKERAKVEGQLGLEQYRQQGRVQLANQQSSNRMNETTHNANVETEQALNEQRLGLSTGKGNNKVASANAMASALKQFAGWSDDQIRAEYPRLLGIYRQSQNPREMLQSTLEMLEKNNFGGDWSKLTAEQKQQAAWELVQAGDKIIQEERATNTGGQTGGPGLSVLTPNGIQQR